MTSAIFSLICFPRSFCQSEGRASEPDGADCRERPVGERYRRVASAPGVAVGPSFGAVDGLSCRTGGRSGGAEGGAKRRLGSEQFDD